METDNKMKYLDTIITNKMVMEKRISVEREKRRSLMEEAAIISKMVIRRFLTKHRT